MERGLQNTQNLQLNVKSYARGIHWVDLYYQESKNVSSLMGSETMRSFTYKETLLALRSCWHRNLYMLMFVLPLHAYRECHVDTTTTTADW